MFVYGPHAFWINDIRRAALQLYLTESNQDLRSRFFSRRILAGRSLFGEEFARERARARQQIGAWPLESARPSRGDVRALFDRYCYAWRREDLALFGKSPEFDFVCWHQIIVRRSLYFIYLFYGHSYIPLWQYCFSSKWSATIWISLRYIFIFLLYVNYLKFRLSLLKHQLKAKTNYDTKIKCKRKSRIARFVLPYFILKINMTLLRKLNLLGVSVPNFMKPLQSHWVFVSLNKIKTCFLLVFKIIKKFNFVFNIFLA